MRPCLACGYDLSGHGEEPRCPECGLLNIPEGYRRQVWELVDSGKWFFSGPLNFFRKRPPGWWWALDRPDDIRRALRSLARNAVLSLIVLSLSFVAASAVAVEYTEIYRAWDIDDPARAIVYQASRVTHYGPFRDNGNVEPVTEPDWTEIYRSTRNFVTGTTSRLVILRPDPAALLAMLPAAGWLSLTWIGPVFLGLVTQIRKGLPPFARPPRTILAAGIYESHRMIYVTAIVSLVVLLDALWVAHNAFTGSFLFLASSGAMLVVIYAIAGWIGPLRSDYTKQLIRSPFHAFRIVVMYALLFPLLITWCVAVVASALSDW